jgi:hypothetical protein
VRLSGPALRSASVTRFCSRTNWEELTGQYSVTEGSLSWCGILTAIMGPQKFQLSEEDAYSAPNPWMSALRVGKTCWQKWIDREILVIGWVRIVLALDSFSSSEAGSRWYRISALEGPMNLIFCASFSV